jgi:general secretion pathway protein G
MKIRNFLLQKAENHIRELRKKDKSSGATLVEMIVTITIIMILMGAIAAGTFIFIAQANRARAVADIASFDTAMTQYKMENKFKIPAESEGLNAFIKYLNVTTIPLDPWGNPYIYKVPGPAGKEYEIKSNGRDGQDGGEGDDADISNISQ